MTGILEEDLCAIRDSLSMPERNFYRDGVLLITGCAGSLGFELLHYLVAYSGARRIIGIDNYCLGRPAWLQRLVRDKKIEFYEQDISRMELSMLPGADEVTHVFHMASLASPVAYREDPLATMDANVGGCRNLLEFYRGKQLRTFCYFSSSEI